MSRHHDSDQLGQRLRALVDHHVSDEVRARHLAAIDAELAHQPEAISKEPAMRLPARWRARRWVAGLAATATLLTPGMAVAAHDAVPGDTLYSVKRATEQLHMIVTPDVAARNRVTELTALLDRDTPPDTLTMASQAARDAVAALPDGHPLHEQLAALLARITGPQGEDAAPPPPTNTVTSDEREPEEGSNDDHNEPDDRDEPAGHLHDTDEDTDDVEDGDGLHDETNEADNGDELGDDTDDSDEDVEQDEPDDDSDEHESEDTASADNDDGSDDDDD